MSGSNVGAMRGIQPGPGQESVWDYPRPAVVEATTSRLQVMFHGRCVGDTARGYRVLETSHPPTYYLPRVDLDDRVLRPSNRRSSICEWKGQATYYDVVVDGMVAEAVCWTYPRPTSSFACLADAFAFYPSRMEACFVDGEKVDPQAGDFYGGWVTSKIVGPFKGGPGTWGW